jgi:hypothetical protein
MTIIDFFGCGGVTTNGSARKIERSERALLELLG